MDPTIRRMTNRYSAITAVTSFVTQPIPGADELIVIPLHYRFAVLLTRQRGVPLLTAPWWQVSKIIWGGAAVRLAANFTLGLVPVVGLFSNAITAVALTEFLGRYLDDALSNPAQPAAVSVQAVRDAVQDSLRSWGLGRLWPGSGHARRRAGHEVPPS